MVHIVTKYDQRIFNQINHPAAVASADIPHIYVEDALNGWSNIVSQVHQVGGKIIPRLWHVGAREAGSVPNLEPL